MLMTAEQAVLPVLKQYTKALAENANASQLSAARPIQEPLDWKKAIYGITMGFAGMAGLTTTAISIMNETIEAHPDKFDADLELANIYANNDQASEAETVIRGIQSRWQRQHQRLGRPIQSALRWQAL